MERPLPRLVFRCSRFDYELLSEITTFGVKKALIGNRVALVTFVERRLILNVRVQSCFAQKSKETTSSVPGVKRPEPHSILRRDSHDRFVECGIRRLARGTVLVGLRLGIMRVFCAKQFQASGLPLKTSLFQAYLVSRSKELREMQIRSRLFSLVIVASLVLSLGVIGSAQTKKKRSRRASKPAAPKPVITNPSIAPPTAATSGDVKIISTADQNLETETSDTVPAAKTKPTGSTTAPESETMQQTITTLSNQVNRLSDKLSSMQEDDRYLLDMERLTRAEQRAEQLRSQLFDVQSKIADAQARLEQIEYALKPENIERTTQNYGTVHPEEARDARRKQLEGEKSRVTAQLNLYESGKNRLETSVASADSEVDLLRAKLTQRREQMDAASSNDARPAPESRPRKP